jgi:hypothetical protein
MAPPAVGVGTLRRLAGLQSDGHPVLSVYLDVDTATFPSRSGRGAELEALIASAGPHAEGADVSRVWQMLRSMAGLAHGTRGLAMFSSSGGSAFEAVALPSPVEPMAVVDETAWLEPLASMFTSGNWGVALVGSRAVRLFRGGSRSLVEFAALDGATLRRPAIDGCSQSSTHYGIEEPGAASVRWLAEHLLRAHRRRAFEPLVVIAASELWAMIEASLHNDLCERLAGLVQRDLEHAQTREIAQAVASFVGPAQRTVRQLDRPSPAVVDVASVNGWRRPHEVRQQAQSR